MPSKPRPKFEAVVKFTVAGETFKPGDPVEGAALNVVRRFGERYVTKASRKENRVSSETETKPPVKEKKS